MPPAATSKLDLRGVFGNSNFSLTEVPNDKRTAEWEQAREKAPDMALNLWGQGTDALAVRVAVRVGAGSVLPARVRRVLRSFASAER